MMLRRSYPGRIDYIDLGPGAASAQGVRGTFVVPERAAESADDPKVLARRERQRVNRRAWRDANREHVRAYDRARKAKAA